ncbi:MAG TPA: methyltransferase domain-containing protein [Nocardioidaceae bacterium]|nr:methyltransferase domain-containing protein [Nocardioidaceae bacterium]
MPGINVVDFSLLGRKGGWQALVVQGPKTEELRDRLYSAYSSHHAGVADEGSSALSFRRDVLPHLPDDLGTRVVDLGCGQGQMVRLMLGAGYAQAGGIDISPQQVELAHAAGIAQVVLGDYRQGLDGPRQTPSWQPTSSSTSTSTRSSRRWITSIGNWFRTVV